MIETTLKKIENQINETIDYYKYLEVKDINVYIEENKICFEVGIWKHQETEEELQTAYVMDEKVKPYDALAMNTAVLLDEMNDIMKNNNSTN
jgi:hypothetical protein